MDYEENRPLLAAIPPEYGTETQMGADRRDSTNIMENPPIGVSQQHLVDARSEESQSKLWPQFLAGIIATLGALATGTVLGWSSPANEGLPNDYFQISEEEYSWVSSLSTLGCACICIPIGFTMDAIGRKLTMLLLVIPFTVGWILLITATNVEMLYAGRFIVGLAGGAFCVTAPTYTSEIAVDSVRGTLGTLFQLMVTVGILVSYVIGSYVEFKIYNIICLVIPIIFGILFFFMPETPHYNLMKGKKESATKSLIWLRGEQYDIESEMDIIQRRIDASQNNNMSFVQTFSKSSVVKTIFICYSIMFFQQFSGINAVLFNIQAIFSSSNSGIDDKVSTIIIGAIQVFATAMSTIAIDKLGRKLLLLISGFMMCLCGIALGVFFIIQKGPNANPELASDLSWLPLTSLCIFIASFSIGYGPIPWIMASELSTPETKAIISSTAGTFNWILAFIITYTYASMTASMQEYGVFWFFASCMALSVVFVAIFVFETKGKSSEEIQKLLGAEVAVPHNHKSEEKI